MSRFNTLSRSLAFALVASFFSLLVSSSAFALGAKPDEAFFVRCDRSTMTQNSAGGVEVQPFFEVGVPAPQADGEVTPIDALIIINELNDPNGRTIETSRYNLNLGLSSGPTAGAAGCNTNCAEIGKTCVCLEGTGLCGCGTLSFAGVPVTPASVTLEYLVLMTVVLDPEGSELASDRTVVYPEGTTTYNRAIESVELRPNERDPNSTDVLVGVRIDAQSFERTPLNLSFGVEIAYEGETGGSTTISPPPFVDVSGDNGTAAAAGCNTNCAEIGKTCVCIQGTGLCGCGSIFEIISGLPPIPVPMTELDVESIVVRLVPAPGALPELPPFEEDDEAQPEIPEEEPVDDSNRPFRRGDANMSGEVDLGDQIFLLAFLFQGGPAPHCDDAADANDDGSVDIGDPIAGLAWLFQGGDEPPFPGPYRCAGDPTLDRLGCAGYRVCDL